MSSLTEYRSVFTLPALVSRRFAHSSLALLLTAAFGGPLLAHAAPSAHGHDPGGSGAASVAVHPADDEDPRLALAPWREQHTSFSVSGGLTTSPLQGLVGVGPLGGPFVPDYQIYTLSNTTGESLFWGAYTNVPWIRLSSVFGKIAPGSSVTLIAALDPSVATNLSRGTYNGQLYIGNLSDGTATSRPMSLTTLPPSNALVVTPSGGMSASGPVGGTIAPTSKTFTLRNTSSKTLVWAASGTSFAGVAPGSGSLQPGAQSTLTVSIDTLGAASLSPGQYKDTVVIADSSSGGGSTSFPVCLTVTASGYATSSSFVTQHGITWTFDQPYTVGQFANGDWWVVGPVRIVDIDPPSLATNGRTTHGSMINPSPRDGLTQGYDSTMYAQYQLPGDYDPELNVALGVSPSAPLVVPTHSSLVSTKSRPQAAIRPQVEAAAILTVLDAVPPPGSFRPPYCGTDKSIEFNEDELDYSLLERLDPVNSTPELEDVAGWFERPWLDHVPDWPGRYIHPVENMPDYGREMCDQVSTAALMLHLNYTDAAKRDLLVRFVQLGLDFYGIVEDGGQNNWPAGGGHHSGRKWPILFAGIMLGDSDMGLIGFDDSVAFNEDDQTFHVEETAPGVFNYGQGGYTAADLGLAEWGTQHWKQIKRGQLPTLDDANWFGNAYRTCCTANSWWGQVLAAHIMGARWLWNHEPLFDYLDRYRMVAPSTGQAQWTISWSDFPLDMWSTYRAAY